MATIEDLEIRRYREDDEEAFRNLMHASFNRSFSLKVIREIFETGVFGAKNIGFIAFKGKMAVAYYGVLPVKLNYSGKEILVAQSGNTMTHPEFQGLGLFTLLAKKCYELAKEEGIKFVFGWPNENSYPGFVKKLDWKELGSMTKYKTTIKTLPLAKAASRFSFLKPFYSFYRFIVLAFYKKGSGPLEIPYSNGNFIPRNENYLSYKKIHGSFRIKLCGEDIILKVDSGLRIGDMSMRNEKNFPLVLSKLKKLAFLFGANELSFISSPGVIWNEKFKETWKSEKSLPHMYVKFYEEFPLEGGYFTHLDFDTF